MIFKFAALKASMTTATENTGRLVNSRVLKAVLVIMAVWVVSFSALNNIDTLAGRRVEKNRGAFDRLAHGGPQTQNHPQTSTQGHVSDTDVPELQTPSRPHDTLITYVYAESAFGRENLAYFIQIGLHRAADFVFIFNGETDAANLLPDWDNIRVVRRNNTCYDMGAVGEALRTNNLWKSYTKFMSINSSLRGPFVPYWSGGCWTDLYLNKITDTVKFVGLTANCHPRPHVQSMIFATDDTGMSILLDPDHATSGVADKFGGADDPVGLTGCYNNHRSAVHSEVGLTTLIQNAGYAVDVMMAAIHQETSLEAYCNATNSNDVLFNDAYFGFNVHPYETIFIKTNRDIDPVAIKKLSEWHLKRNMTSQTLCPAR
ncbi:hypothetical protein SPBR_07481 [Sporothrix brasiliensis 5110]|uniref:Uncharacterized protein n=1 Tax=Sporothrix brasiliensis 5110 TaxID=1398154 RepID=A0A0C2ES96_9PEZI|nr:uncharacterized protein SPBR_07481 [Sporothrix brasiliensis 5110]KIH89214.1 hypothetical protein SPBR_07481 [Sporothrix brasiliensis 5110]